jgi:hypothetical protein
MKMEIQFNQTQVNDVTNMTFYATQTVLSAIKLCDQVGITEFSTQKFNNLTTQLNEFVQVFSKNQQQQAG